jgi:hypothetical protein
MALDGRELRMLDGQALGPLTSAVTPHTTGPSSLDGSPDAQTGA